MTTHPQQSAVDPSVPADELRRIADGSLELARLVATNPSADSSLLTHLAAKRDSEVLTHLASHPALPMELIITVGRHAPRQMWENPAFALWILEYGFAINPIINQNFYGYLDMVKHPETPADFLRYLAKCGRANGHVVAHANAPVDLIEALTNKSLDKPVMMDPVPGAAATNPRTPSHLLERIFEHVSPQVSKQDLKFPWDVRGLQNEQYKVMIAIASNPNAPSELLKKLANCQNANVQRAATKNPNFVL